MLCGPDGRKGLYCGIVEKADGEERKKQIMTKNRKHVEKTSQAAELMETIFQKSDS